MSCSRCVIEKLKTKYYAFKSSEPLDTLGSFTARVSRSSGPTPLIPYLVIVLKDKVIRNAKCGILKPADGVESQKTLRLCLKCNFRAIFMAISFVSQASST